MLFVRCQFGVVTGLCEFAFDLGHQFLLAKDLSELYAVLRQYAVFAGEGVEQRLDQRRVIKQASCEPLGVIFKLGRLFESF